MSDDEFQIIKYALYCIVGIVIAFFLIPAGLNAYVTNQNTIRTSVSTICNIDQIVIDSISDTTITEIQNPRAREIITEIKNTGHIQTCQMKELFSLLTDVEKKKINLQESMCNVVDCIT